MAMVPDGQCAMADSMAATLSSVEGPLAVGVHVDDDDDDDDDAVATRFIGASCVEWSAAITAAAATALAARSTVDPKHHIPY